MSLIKNAFYLFILLIVGRSMAQKTVLDTINTVYKTKLTAHFDTQITKTKSRIDRIDERKVRKQLEAIYAESTAEFKALIKKGVFVEHDAYSDLVQSIFEKIRKNNLDQNLNDIKLLLSVSKEINAYNAGDDIVVLNLPLLYKIDSQQELAFIICHEISHQLLNHVYNSMYNKCQQNHSIEIVQKTKEIEKQKYNKGALASELFKKVVYANRKESRQHEQAADSLGYILFKNSYPNENNYAIETLRTLKTIDVVKDSLVSADFERLFQTPTVKFKTDWLRSELSSYNYQKTKRFWDIDSLRTHPDCDERILALTKTFKIKEKPKSEPDLIFAKLKKNADYEYVFGLYFIEEYGKSLYETLLKLKRNPTDDFYRKMVYVNLTKLQNARNKFTVNRYLETESPNFSESYNQFLCLVRNLRKAELNEFITFYKPKP